MTMAAAEDAARAARQAASTEMEVLRFGFPPSASREIVPSIMTEIHRHFPRVKMDILLLHTSVILSQVHSSALDLGFVRLPVEDDDLNIVPAHREPLVVCLPKNHALSNASQISIADLRSERFIMYGRKWAPGYCDQITNRCLEEGFSPIVSTEIDEMYVAPALVASGEGIAILPKMVIPSPIEDVVLKELEIPDLCSQMGIVTLSKHSSPIIGAVVAISREVCASFSVQ